MFNYSAVCTFILCLSTSVFITESQADTGDEKTLYDHLIENASIYDGSGGKPYQADIAIRGEKIAKIGDLDKKDAKFVTDGTGLVVSPGFINMLSWAPVSLQVDGRGMSDVLQGVTLEVFGEGLSLGPSNDQSFEMATAFLPPMDRKPEWATFGGFMQFLEDKGVSPNVASFVGAATVRSYVMGYETGNPTADELAQMKALVNDAMLEGALGLGSSLIYVPAKYATTQELTELCKVVAKYDGMYISHIRSESNGLLAAAQELLTISESSGVRAEFYHLKAEGPDNWHQLDSLIALIEKARANGQPISADIYPYAAASTGLEATIPPWVLEGGVEEMLKRLSVPKLRERIKKEMNTVSDTWDNGYKWASPDNMLLVDFSNKSMIGYVGKTLHDVAKERGIEPEYAAMDLILENGEGRIDVVYFSMSEDNIRKKIQKPWITFGSDGFTLAAEDPFTRVSTHPRDYGTFARILGRYVREEKLISLPEAIHRMTALPAQRLGIEKRGLLKEGYFADIVIFNADTIIDHATFEKPHQYATGVQHVWINGTHVVVDGQHTGKKTGKFVRGPGWKPGF